MDRETLLRSSRRHFLAQQSVGIGSLALAWLLNQDELRAARQASQAEPGKADLRPEAEAGRSAGQGDGDDLDVHAGRAEPHRPVRSQAGADQAAPAELHRRHQVRQRRRGQRQALRQPVEVLASTASAAWSCRELLPHLGEVADDITLIRSMHTGVNNHGQSINALNGGRIHQRPARRSARG